MSEKLQKILEEIKLGIRKNTYDLEITPEEYLEKDENEISFLEHLFINNISIFYKDEEKFKRNIEIGYIYCKNDKRLSSFDFSEEDLFSKIDNKIFIEFIIEKEKITSNIVKKINKHLEIIDMLISTNNFFCLEYINEKLVDKLTTKQENGLYPIEQYLSDEKIYRYLIPLVNDITILTELSTKYSKIDHLKYVNKNILMIEFDENENMLNLLINNMKIVPKVLENLPKDINFINFLRKNNFYEYLKKASEDVLLLKIEEEKTLLEELFEKGYKPKLTGFIWEEQTIKILNKHMMLGIVNETKVMESMLLKSVSEVLGLNDIYNRNLLEYLLDNGYEPLKQSYSITNIEIIKILYNKGYYKLLGEKLNEKGLLLEIEPGILIIDQLLGNDINFNIDTFESIEMAKKLYEIKRFDLLAVGDIDTLLNNYDANNSYFDDILEEIKARNIEYSLTNYRCSNENMAKFYILIAKHGMVQYIDELEEEKLLKKYNEKTLLEELLDIDLELTLNKILTKNTKAKPIIAAILKNRGIEQQNIDVIIETQNYTKEYLDNINSTLGIGPLYNEGEYLLKTLEQLFMNDGKSDPELISALIVGYRDSLINNYEINIQELRSLVEIKTKNIERFFYIKEENSGYFSRFTGSVYCDDSTISTLLHETGHALHYYLADMKIPENYSEIVKKIKQNPQTIKKVEQYSKKFNELYDKIEISIKQKCEEYFGMNFDEKEEDIISFLNKTKEEQKEEFKNLDISEETLDIIFSDIFTKDEYFAHQKRMYIRKNVDAVLRSEFGAYIAIGDIIDAVYDGDFRSGILKDEEGKEIKPTFGHGIAYYFAREHGFDEMFANFCAILKSKDCNQVLELLKDILGNELYTMFNEFYQNNILNSNETILDDQKLL